MVTNSKTSLRTLSMSFRWDFELLFRSLSGNKNKSICRLQAHVPGEVGGLPVGQAPEATGAAHRGAVSWDSPPGGQGEGGKQWRQVGVPGAPDRQGKA